MGKNLNDALGGRMKEYEARETERKFFPTLPIYARIDGRGFSKVTKGMARPYDIRMVNAMVATTMALVDKTHALIGYTQSDEISLVWQAPAYDKNVFFDGKIQKMVSVLAGIATAAFNQALQDHFMDYSKYQAMLPHFDARVIQMPNQSEAANMFLWRNLDATKNAVSMAAQHYFSHNSLQKKSGADMQEMLFQEKGINFNEYPSFFKRGTWVRRFTREVSIPEAQRMKIKVEHRPEAGTMVTRSFIEPFDLPPFSKVTNREAVIFDGADYEVKS